MIAAILRAQLLSMRFRGGARRSSAFFGTATGLIFYGFWAFLAWTAMLFFSLPDQTPLFVPVLAGSLLFVMLYWQVAPILSASFGASLDLRKLLAYPIPHNKLFLVEILLRITTCLEMLLLVLGVAAGLLRNPRFGWLSAPGILAGAFFFVATNILFSAGTRNWLERLFLRSRLKEAAMFFFVFAAVLPQLLIAFHVRKQAVFQAAPTQLFWPWAAMGRLMLHDSPALSLLSSAVWFSTAADIRNQSIADTLFRFPSRFLPDPLAAVVEKELRSFARIARFRLVYVMSCSFGIVLYMPSLQRGRAHNSFFFQNALPFMALYGLLLLGQISYWNSFGFDRSAAQGYFSWPIRFRDVLIAKNLSVIALLIPQILIISLVCRAASMPVSAGKVIETIVVMTIAAMYWFALGNICSVRIPRALDPDKMNQMANKMQALTVFAAPFLLLPLALAYWSRWFFESQLVFAGIVLVAAIVGGIFYWVGLDSAVESAYNCREKMLQELSRSDGPLSIT